MQYPSVVKVNMRYRGPVESAKFNKNASEALSDLVRSHKRLDEVKEKLDEVKKILWSGHDTVPGMIDTTVRIGRLERSINLATGGIRNA